MAKIVGRDETAVKRTACRKCAALVEYTLGEIRTLWSGKDYSGGSDGAEGFTCPGCGEDIITKRW